MNFSLTPAVRLPTPQCRVVDAAALPEPLPQEYWLLDLERKRAPVEGMKPECLPPPGLVAQNQRWASATHCSGHVLLVRVAADAVRPLHWAAAWVLPPPPLPRNRPIPEPLAAPSAPLLHEPPEPHPPARYRRTQAATAQEQSPHLLSPALSCDASSGRASISACLACNTPEALRAIAAYQSCQPPSQLQCFPSIVKIRLTGLGHARLLFPLQSFCAYARRNSRPEIHQPHNLP